MILYEERQKELERKLEGDIERYEIIANNFMNNPQSNAFSNSNYKYLLDINKALYNISNKDNMNYTSVKAYNLYSKLNKLLHLDGITK